MRIRWYLLPSFLALVPLLLAAFPFQTALAQRTIQVPADAPTVQRGIDMANAGDIVNIAPGVYF